MDRRGFLITAAGSLPSVALATEIVWNDPEARKIIARHMAGGVTGGGQDESDPIQVKAEAIAAELKDLPQFAGFETILIAILTSLLPMLLKCLFPDPEPPTPAQMKKMVEKHWNSRRQEYDRNFIRRGKVQARKQAKAEGKLLTDKQAELMVVTSADHFRLGEDDDLQLFGKAVWASNVKAAVED